jgi:uncharacterized protein YjeT (DUF2065 family)
MRLAGLALILLGLVSFVMPAYAQYVPMLRGVHAGDLRLWGAMIIGAGAIALALSRRA